MAGQEHDALIAALTRRQVLARAAAGGLAAVVASALPAARAVATPRTAAAAATGSGVSLTDATLQAFADTMIPGRRVTRTESGAPVHPQAIAGVDAEPGAVEADTLALYHHPRIGFDALAPAFLAALEATALTRGGGPFLQQDFAHRVRTCVTGLAYDNPVRLLWEAAAAVPFAAFCGAAMVPEQTADTAVGYAVMGLPGRAPNGYPDASYRRRLAEERTTDGNLP